MKRSLPLVAASIAGLLLATTATAQQRTYGQAWGHSDQRQQNQHDNRGNNSRSGDHYYNGRWVDDTEWNRHSQEQNRWSNNNNNQRRKNNNNSNNNNGSAALLGGIIGFALGAAIIGSQQQADHARTADQGWDGYCAKKYRSYDRNSRTYMGYDGARHYCQ
jgi:hypothetical protein